jgi:hypothetical protein
MRVLEGGGAIMWRLALATDSGSPENFGLGSKADTEAEASRWIKNDLAARLRSRRQIA